MRRPTVRQDAFGIFAEQFARFMGTARFLIYMTLFVIIWIAWNLLAPVDLRWDDYPFIFLTLMLSLQASYAAPLILLAQNRQEVRDRVINEQDRQANARAHADMEFLAREVASLRMALGEVATRDFLRSELRNVVEELDDDARRKTPRTRPRDATYAGAMTSPAIERVQAALATVNDPEIKRPITELGMVENIDIDDTGLVAVKVLLTVAGCPLKDTIISDVTAAVTRVEGVTASTYSSA